MGLLSKETIKGIRKEDTERKEKLTGDKRPIIEGGQRILILDNVEIKNAKTTGDSRLVVTLVENEEKKPLEEGFMITGPKADLGLKFLVNFLANSFGYEIAECENEIDILNEVRKFKGKNFKAAIKIEERLFAWGPNDKGESGLSIQKNAKLWYTGKIDDNGFKVDISKTTVPLSTEDKAKWIEYQKNKPKDEDKKPFVAHEEKDGDSGLPF